MLSTKPARIASRNAGTTVIAVIFHDKLQNMTDRQKIHRCHDLQAGRHRQDDKNEAQTRALNSASFFQKCFSTFAFTDPDHVPISDHCAVALDEAKLPPLNSLLAGSERRHSAWPHGSASSGGAVSGACSANKVMR